tara:strand:- start:26 stop:1033 length:1008 start_codon:yes stop_codon:yes gene_type:complete
MNINRTFFKNNYLLVAEIGNNHEGNINNAIKLINAAKKAGANAVKFQTFKTELYVSKNENPERFKRLKQFELSDKNLIKIVDHCKKQKIVFFSTPFDPISVNFLSKFQSIFKISSSDITNKQILKPILSMNKSLIISTGFSDEKTIDPIYKKCVSYFRKNNKFFSILYCVSDYPTNPNNLNLVNITEFKKRYRRAIIGFSDHTLGYESTIYSYILGARIIEKHFTLDNNFSDFIDHKISLNPEQFTKLSTELKKIKKIIGYPGKKLTISEKKNYSSVKRSWYLSKDKNKFEKIDKSDLIFLRPFKKNALDYKSLIDKKINKSISKGSFLKKSDLI